VKRALGLALVLAGVPAQAWAQDGKVACVESHEQGQVSRRDGHFSKAREEFSSCTSDACPAPVRQRCSAFLAELDAAQPTIVIALHDPQGRDVGAGLTLSIDAGPPGPVPATAIRLDPGEHALRVQAGTQPPVERPIVVREGEKERRIDIVVAAEQLPRADAAMTYLRPPPPQPSTARYWWLGASGIALVGAAATSAAGWAVHGHLASSCSPSCSSGQVESLRVLWPASFVALGVGVVTGAVALALFLTEPAPGPDRVGLHLTPTGAGWSF